MAQHKFAISLNDNDPEESAWLDEMAKSGMGPSQVIKAAMRTHFGTSVQSQDVVTNKDVVLAIRELGVLLSKKLDRITVQSAVQRQPTPDIARKEEELTEADVELSQVFVTALKKAARPGMRYEET